MPRATKTNARNSLWESDFPDLLPVEEETTPRKMKRAPTIRKPEQEVIDLSNESEEAILSRLLDDDSDDAHYVSLQKRSQTADTARTADSDDSRYENNSYEEHGQYYDEEEEEEEEDEASVASDDSESVGTLLTKAHDRLHFQELQDEVTELKAKMERKNEELENLSGQLRRAVATKCDLVLAHTELELHHEQNLKRREMGMQELKKANFGLVEAQSEVEKDLLNEIFELTERLKATELQHRNEIKDWDQAHQNELAQKDYKISKLQEEIRKIRYEGKSAAPTSIFSGILSN